MEEGLYSKITEIELRYRNRKKPQDQPVVKTNVDAYLMFHDSWDHDKMGLQEQFRVMLLTSQNRCLGISTIATGAFNNVSVDVRLAFALALKTNARGMVIAHNHPSGDLNFSKADIQITEAFNVVGQILEVPVMDHLLLTPDGFSSLVQEGKMPAFEQDNKDALLKLNGWRI